MTTGHVASLATSHLNPASPASTGTQLHSLTQWAATWWPLLVVLAVVALTGRWWVTTRLQEDRARHGPGMATRRRVLAASSLQSLRRRARYTRPALAKSDARRAGFADVGARIGQIGLFRSHWFGISHEEAVGVLAPQRQGKTRRVLARLIIDSPGTAVFASTKPDLLGLVAARLQGRRVFVLDPDAQLPTHMATWTDDQTAGKRAGGEAGGVRHHAALPVAWSPVIGCENADIAIRRAKAWVGDGENSDTTNSQFFAGSAAIVLRCYLHAAAIAGLDMAAVRRWAADPTDKQPRTILTSPAAAAGWDADLAGQLTGSKSQDDVFKQLYVSLELFASPSVLARACPPPHEHFDVDAFLYSGQALFVLASEAAVNSSAYTTTFLTELVERAKELALRFPTGRWEPPITVTLDELPNIARIPTFPRMLADSGGRGISIRWAAQGRNFLSDVWGPLGAGLILENSTTRVVLRGLADADYLSDLEHLAGYVDRMVPGHEQPQRRPVLPINELANQDDMTATVFTTAAPPFRCRLVDIDARAVRRPRRARTGSQLGAPETPLTLDRVR